MTRSMIALMGCVYAIGVHAHLYIGSTIDFNKRKSGHLAGLRRQSHENPILQRLYNKYGEDSLAWGLLLECEDDQLVEAEIEACKVLNPDINIIEPGSAPMRGRNHSAKSRAKMSIAKRAMSDETKAKISVALRGRKHSPEHNANISRGLKGRACPLEVRRKISDAQRGRPRGPDTLETKQRKSEAAKRAWARRTR